MWTWDEIWNVNSVSLIQLNIKPTGDFFFEGELHKCENVFHLVSHDKAHYCYVEKFIFENNFHQRCAHR